jgi:hypothetical protein
LLVVTASTAWLLVVVSALAVLAAAVDLIMSKKPCLDNFLTCCFDSLFPDVDVCACHEEYMVQ